MLKRPAECRGCPLDTCASGFSHPEGTGVNRVLLVGEGLGGTEARDGLPFRPMAPAGHVLEMAIKSLGLDRQQFALWNIVGCQPPDNELSGSRYEYEAIHHCKVHFRAVMQKYQPRVMVALGAVASRVLTGLTGKRMSLDMIQGFPLDAWEYPGVKVYCTYHPSYIQRGAWEVYPVFRSTLAKAVRTAVNGFTIEEVHYNESGDIKDLQDYKEYLIGNPTADLNVDFETRGEEIDVPVLDEDEVEQAEWQKKIELEAKQTAELTVFQEITQVNLSLRIGEAAAFEMNEETRPYVSDILALQNPKNGHNFWMFDYPVALFNQLIVNGRVDDTMWMFHHAYPDLPGKKGKAGASESGLDKKDLGSLANLQYCASFYNFPFPWKHLRTEREGYYGCCDSDAGIRVFYGVRRDLEKLGIWKGYDTFVYQVMPILRRAQERGVLLNKQKLIAFIYKLKALAREALLEINPLVPDAVRPVKQAMGLKRTPAPSERVDMVFREFIILEPEQCHCSRKVKAKKCKKCKGIGGQFGDGGSIVDCDNCNGTGEQAAYVDVYPACEDCKGKGILQGKIWRWAKLEEFNPNSPHQMKKYAGHMHHVIPRNSKREYAMDKETLAKLAKTYNDPLYKLVIKSREFEKLDSTYGSGWLKRMDPDGYIRRHQFSFLPATGQLSCINPNLQNAPHPVKQGKLAEEFRDAVEASPGHILIELDYKSYHAQTLAWEAKDWDYLRLAKLDIHSYLAGQMLHIPGYQSALSWDDQKLSSWLNQIKKEHEKVRNQQAKPAILGYGFGMGGGRLYRTNPDNFRDMREAMGVFDTLDKAFTKAAKYRADSPIEAKPQKHLKSVFDCIRWFFNIETYDFQKRRWDHGLDWEKAIAFRPANDAFSQKKLALLRLDELGLLEKYRFILDIHDAFLFDCPLEYAEECVYSVKREMEQPSTVMLMPDGSGFTVDVDIKAGLTWAKMSGDWKKELDRAVLVHH